MDHNDTVLNERLRSVMERVLKAAPADGWPPEIAEQLRSTRLGDLRMAADALIKGGQLDAAEQVFHALEDRSANEPWVFVGQARIAVVRKNWAAAAVAWKSCLDRFPDRAAPFWWTELANAELRCGNYDGAEAALESCRTAFPDHAPAAAGSAEVARMRGDDASAVELWKATIREFPNQIASHWLANLAASLHAVGQEAEADAVLDELAWRFPDSAAALSHQAAVAERRGDWAEAQRLWTICVHTHASMPNPAWRHRGARALIQLGRFEDALACWCEIVRDFPDFEPGRPAMADAAQRLGRWSLARRCYSEQLARFADRVSPAWLAGHARALLFEGACEAAEIAIAELNRRFPDALIGGRLIFDYCHIAGVGLDVVAPRLEAALGRFPDDRYLMAQYTRALLASGRLADAERVVRSLEAGGDDPFALVSRWRVDLDRDGLPSIRDRVTRILSGRAWRPEEAISLVNFLLPLLSLWAAALARRLIEDVIERSPADYRSSTVRWPLLAAYANALVALREDDLALQAIDALPELSEERDVGELRAWAAYRRGELGAARRILRGVCARVRFPAIEGSAPELERLTPELETLAPGGVTAFLNVKDEMANLPEFLRHHRGLGVRRFVAVDNMSRDGGPAYLAAQPDVILYRTPDQFHGAGAGMRWVNMLRDRHCQAGWGLYLDADEALIYPGWETTTLDRFTAYLDHEGAECVGAFMLDLYPDRLIDSRGDLAPHTAYRYYDADYEWRGQVRTPYVQPVGGVRTRLFGVHEMLHKTPLLRHGAGVYIDAHTTTPARLSKVTGALLHYKLRKLASTLREFEPGPDDNPFMPAGDRLLDTMRRTVRYVRHISRLRDADLREPGLSEALTDSIALADSGLMQAPPRYREWLRAGSASDEPGQADQFGVFTQSRSKADFLPDSKKPGLPPSPE